MIASAVAAPYRWDFVAIGTTWRIDTATELDDGDRAAVGAVVASFDRDWSRFRGDSGVSRIAAGGAIDAPADTAAMLDVYVALDAATHGAVNPLVGDALARRGYDPAISLRDRGAQSAPAEWRSLIDTTGGRLRLDRPAMIDVGAVGKGRLVDLVLAALRSRVEGAVVVDASGDLAVHGTPQRVALEHPYDTTRAIGVWTVSAGALCASATNRRSWGDGLHHVLDARTGEPVRRFAATWAVAGDAMTADAAATALFFDGGPQFAADRDVSWVRMSTDGSVEWSPDCEAELFV